MKLSLYVMDWLQANLIEQKTFSVTTRSKIMGNSVVMNNQQNGMLGKVNEYITANLISFIRRKLALLI